MPVKLLRWKSGASGDTVLKLLLESNPTISSQVLYVNNNKSNRSTVDLEYVTNFKYKEIALMSTSYNKINENVLLYELQQLDSEDKDRQWLLKTHSYINFPYSVIDIITDNTMLPFAVTACLKKNFQGENVELNPWYDTKYNNIVSKIKDTTILYKYHCYNLAIDRVSTKIFNSEKIKLIDILSGWSTFLSSVESVQLHVANSAKNHYDQWLKENSIFFPSKDYISLVNAKKYDYHCTKLSLEERYCLLALAGEKFKIL